MLTSLTGQPVICRVIIQWTMYNQAADIGIDVTVQPNGSPTNANFFMKNSGPGNYSPGSPVWVIAIQNLFNWLMTIKVGFSFLFLDTLISQRIIVWCAWESPMVQFYGRWGTPRNKMVLNKSKSQFVRIKRNKIFEWKQYCNWYHTIDK